jgi:hypothetical protein
MAGGVCHVQAIPPSLSIISLNITIFHGLAMGYGAICFAQASSIFARHTSEFTDICIIHARDGFINTVVVGDSWEIKI